MEDRFVELWVLGLEWKTEGVMDGERADREREGDELIRIGWDESGGEWMGWG